MLSLNDSSVNAGTFTQSKHATSQEQTTNGASGPMVVETGPVRGSCIAGRMHSLSTKDSPRRSEGCPIVGLGRLELPTS